MRNRVAIIRGDMIKSREVDEKEEFWEKIDKNIEKINKEFKEKLLFNLEIFKGDEITGICSNSRDAYIISSRLIEHLHPLKIRVVISEGDLDENRKTDRLNELDGEVFWNASIAMNQLKKSKRYMSIIITDRSTNRILTSLADILTELKYDWTSKEKEIIQVYESKRNQKRSAKKLKISQQSISDGLKRAKYKQIREAEKALLEFI